MATRSKKDKPSAAGSPATAKPRRAGARKKVQAAGVEPVGTGIPGEIILGHGDIVAFEGRETRDMIVANTGDRPIQVGSHCHFFEANRALRFDRAEAYGFRLRIPAGTAVRFEPGEQKRVSLVAIGGNRVVYGINGLTNGSLDEDGVRDRALQHAESEGFSGQHSTRST